MSNNNFNLVQGPSQLSTNNLKIFNNWIDLNKAYIDEIKQIVKDYRVLIKQEEEINKNISTPTSFLNNNKNIKQTFIDKYSSLKDYNQTLIKNFIEFEELKLKYSTLNQELKDINKSITSHIKGKNNNNSFSISSFYNLKTAYSNLIKQSEEKISKLNDEFNKLNETLKKSLADAKYNLLNSVMAYFTTKINEISNMGEYSIKNSNTNTEILKKLYAMKDIQLKIRDYMTQLNNIVQNTANNNFPLIDINKTEEFTEKISIIDAKYESINEILSKSIQDFKTKTLEDITELQSKILDLIQKIKKLVSDFKLKHDIFNDNNFANITSQISSLTKATSSQKYMEKLDEILKNLTKGLNNKTSYVNSANSLSSNSIVEFNKVYESDNNSIQSNNPSFNSIKIGKPIVERDTQNKYNYVKARNKVLGNNNNQLPINSPISKLFNPETKTQKDNSNNNLNVEVRNQTKQEIINKMNSLTVNALEKKKIIESKYGNNQANKIIKGSELAKLRNKLASNLTVLTTKNGKQLQNQTLINKKKYILRKI